MASSTIPAGNEGSSLRLFRNPPFGSTVTVSPGDINVGKRVSDGFLPLPQVNFTSVPNPFGTVFAVAPDFRPSYAAAVQPDAGARDRSLVADDPGGGRRQSGTASVQHLQRQPAGPERRRAQHADARTIRSRRIWPTSAIFASDGLSNYYAGQLTVDKRFSKGLSALVGYTWSHAIDNVVLEFGGGARDRNRRIPAICAPSAATPSSTCATDSRPATSGNCPSARAGRC